MIRPVPEITAEAENFRMERLAPGMSIIRRDPVEPVPVGTYVAMVFRVTGYEQDCDGSLMARLVSVDKTGEEDGWEPDCMGLHPDTTVVLDEPGELWSDPS